MAPSAENPFSPPENPLSPALPPFKDRSTGLVLFGVLEVLLGAFCVLEALAMAVMPLLGPVMGGQGMRPAQAIPMVLLFGGLAVALVWLGVGSMLARRWARALNLVLSWIWLIVGILSLIFVALFAREIRQAIGQEQKIPAEVLLVVQLVMGATLGCVYLVLPAAMVLFYGGRHVRATCEFKDPQPRWTDRCPLPVLAVSVLLIAWAASMSWAIPYHAMFPLFGHLLTGVAGLVAILAMMCLYGLLAWATYRLKQWAWWAVLGVMLFMMVSGAVTFSRMGMKAFYQRMDLPPEQMRMIEKSGMIDAMHRYLPLQTGLYGAAFLGYMLYIRRHFTQAGGTSCTGRTSD